MAGVEEDGLEESTHSAPAEGALDPAGRPHGLIGPFTGRHIALIIGALAAVALLLGAATSSFSGAGVEAPIVVPKTGFYPIGETKTGLAVGERPPPLAAVGDEPVRDLDGKIIELSALEGRPVWVVFWASWCPPCQQETPDLQRAWEANAQTDLAMIAIDVQESTDIVRDYATTYGLTYGLAIDPAGSAFRNWTVFGLPTHYFIGRDGVVADRFFGPLTLEEMQSRIDVIIAP